MYQKQLLKGKYQYDKNDYLGFGMYTKIYRGVQTDSKIEVGIKKIPLPSLGLKSQSTNEYDEMIQKVDREIELLSHNQNYYENIVQIFDCFRDDRNLYLVMEFFEEGTLNDLIERQKVFTEEQNFEILFQIILGFLQKKSKNEYLEYGISLKDIFLKNGVWKLADNAEDRFLGILVEDYEFLRKLKNYEFLAPELMNTSASRQNLSKDQQYTKSYSWIIGCLCHRLLFGNNWICQKSIDKRIMMKIDEVYEIPEDVDISGRCTEI